MLPDPGSWAGLVASFAHSVAMPLLKISVSSSWESDLLVALSAWSASAVSHVSKLCMCLGKVFLLVHCLRGQCDLSYSLPCLFWQTRGPVLQRSNWTLSQLQLSAVCWAERPPSLPGFTNWGSSEQLLHLDGEKAQGTRLVALCLCMHVHVWRAGHWALVRFN